MKLYYVKVLKRPKAFECGYIGDYYDNKKKVITNLKDLRDNFMAKEILNSRLRSIKWFESKEQCEDYIRGSNIFKEN